MKISTVKLPASFALFFFVGITNAWSQDWTLDLNFDVGNEGTKVTEFSSAAGSTFYEKNIVYSGGGSAQLNIADNVEGFGTWGGTKSFPTNLSEGDDVWVKISTYMPQDFDYTTNFSLKFLRLHVDQRGFTDIYINNDGTYKYQNELYTTSNLKFRTLRSTSANYVVGETIVGSVSGATAVVRAIKSAPEASSVQSDRVVFDYSNGLTFDRWEDITGQTSGTTYELNRVDSNSVTDFGTQYPVQKEVWETYVYRVRYSTTDPLVQFYKHVDETGFDADGKPIGGSLKLLFEDDTDYTLVESTDLVDYLYLFTYWNGSSPQAQSMYIDELSISTTPPPGFGVPEPTSAALGFLAAISLLARRRCPRACDKA